MSEKKPILNWDSFVTAACKTVDVYSVNFHFSFHSWLQWDGGSECL